jgi:3-oxoacyl-[acyl-carrier protein] reductase
VAFTSAERARVYASPMNLGLTGRSSIVCGASSGMGLAVAEALAGEGAAVAVHGRRAELLEREAKRIGALAVPGDLTDPADIDRLVDTAVAAHGGVDVLVLNGGGPPPSSVKEPLPNLALSNAVRPGVVGWLKTLAREVGPDAITVNVIAPGRIDTDRFREVYPGGLTAGDLEAIPLQRIGSPREIAAVACFLASDAASYVTGAVVPVDGGFTRSLL